MKGLGEQVHVLFILTILGTTIFFVHALIRTFILAFRAPPPRSRIPETTGPDGFRPTFPIRVHLVQDEEIAARLEDGTVEEDKLEALKVPPPAYGLWRCSVVSLFAQTHTHAIVANGEQRVNPNLLHWQLAEEPAPPVPSLPRLAFEPPAGASEGPRPPSYASDDGVEYAAAARPRNTVYMPPPTNEVHPAYRDLF